MSSRRFILLIEYTGKGNTILALRILLKRMLRTFGWRCLRIKEQTDQPPG